MDYALIFTELGPRTVYYKLLSGMVHSNATQFMQPLGDHSEQLKINLLKILKNHAQQCPDSSITLP